MKTLLIVESPAKAKTINKYLGSTFKVLASFGHVRDLPKKNGSIDVDDNFKAKYQLIARNKKHVDEIIGNAKGVNQILLATDPDREGEAIAWHISEILSKYKDFAKIPIKRVTFNEITAKAIKDAVNHPRDLDINLIDAQQARLTLDYLIGFNISPVLWRKIRSGLSAGRVQSPALRLICERELEIKSFIPEDYFTVLLDSHKKSAKFSARLIKYDNKKIETKTITDKKTVMNICDSITNKVGTVLDIVKKQKNKNPLPPFMTSTLQIDAARKLGFNTDKTMKVAQSLYEGVDLGEDSIGLISYMRTDSVNLSNEAIDEIRQYIKENYESRYLPKSQVKYASKVKNAQEAHEAIRPTSIFRTPQSIKSALSLDQYKLYELIWLRTMASQLNSAILDTLAVDIGVDNGVFRLNGITVNFDGFMKVYQETLEDVKNEDEETDIKLPEFELGEQLPVDKIHFTEHQTEPKPRYTEASLVKTLEELGIGRPSTYAAIISTLKKREYVLMDKKRFTPTDTGMIVNNFLLNHMARYVDYKFTANLEDTLDDISNGKIGKIPVLKDFWHNLELSIEETKNVTRSELITEKLEEDCPKCGKHLVMRFGKFGKFIGCSAYPDCNYMRKLDKEGNAQDIIEPEVVEGRACPKDGGVLLIRNGRYGKFISCKNYPKCKYIENLDQKSEDGDKESIACPECKDGHIVRKKNRYGSWFYACDNYPKCKTLFNSEVLAQKCPECSYKVMLRKITKTKGEQIICPKCSYEQPSG